MGDQITIQLHWGKERITINSETNEDLSTLRAKIYSCTNVLPEKQKLLFKGKLLVEGSLDSNGFSSDVKLMLMGKAESDVSPLEVKVENSKMMFGENVTLVDRVQIRPEPTSSSLPIGLENLGNTCYINSVIQLVYSIPELRKIILTNDLNQGDERIISLLTALKGLFQKLSGEAESFPPTEFLYAFFKAYPQFADKDPESHGFRQQDAEEALSLVLTDLSQHLPGVAQLFSFPLSATMVNQEEDSEKEASTTEDRKLSCIIDNQLNPINQLVDGLNLGLRDTMIKHSAKTGRECNFLKNSFIEKLPNYLLIQKIRFVWLEGDSRTKTEGRKVKILRSVAFPLTLDVFQFCSENLKSHLLSNRKSESEHQKKLDQQFDENFKKMKNSSSDNDEIDNIRHFKQERFEEEQASKNKKIWRETKLYGDTGYYELTGVVTHQGRSADRGHYICWLRMSLGSWYKFDDSTVTRVKPEDVLNLKGGGDWHTAYLLLYRKLQFLPEDTF